MYYNLEYVCMNGNAKVEGGPVLIQPILMQFIGQYDKAGKKLWTGDIIDSFIDKGVIEFSHGVYGINWDYADSSRKTMLGSWGQEHNLRTLDDGFNRDIICIGNICENPDLLIKPKAV